MQNETPCYPPPPPPKSTCQTAGPFDASQIVYHCATSSPSRLTCLGIKNGTSVERILERIDQRLCSMKLPKLCCLSATYTINSWSDFATAVDDAICKLQQNPLQVEDCSDKLIKLTIKDGKITACLDLPRLIDEITKHPEWIEKITKPADQPDMELVEVLC